jgi:hypothetical protein
VGAYLLNWLYIYTTTTNELRKVTFYDGKQIITEMKPVQACVIFKMFTDNGIIDFLRCILFVGTLDYCTWDYSPLNPLPLSWIFDDFPKFLFEPTCVTLFWKYMREREPQRLRILEELMKLYITSYQITDVGPIGSSLSGDYKHLKTPSGDYDLTHVQETEREHKMSDLELDHIDEADEVLAGSLLKKNE